MSVYMHSENFSSQYNMFPCTRIDFPSEAVYRRSRQKEELKFQTQQEHAEQVRERKVQKQHMREVECLEYLTRRPPHAKMNVSKSMMQSLEARRQHAKDVQTRRRQLESQRMQQLNEDLLLKSSRPVLLVQLNKSKTFSRHENVKGRRKCLHSEVQERHEHEVRFKEQQSAIRLNNMSRRNRVMRQNKAKRKTEHQLAVTIKAAERLEYKQQIVQNDMAVKCLRAAQNLEIEKTPVLKSTYRPARKIIRSSKKEPFDWSQAKLNLQPVHLAWNCGRRPISDKTRRIRPMTEYEIFKRNLIALGCKPVSESEYKRRFAARNVQDSDMDEHLKQYGEACDRLRTLRLSECLPHRDSRKSPEIDVSDGSVMFSKEVELYEKPYVLDSTKEQEQLSRHDENIRWQEQFVNENMRQDEESVKLLEAAPSSYTFNPSEDIDGCRNNDEKEQLKSPCFREVVLNAWWNYSQELKQAKNGLFGYNLDAKAFKQNFFMDSESTRHSCNETTHDCDATVTRQLCKDKSQDEESQTDRSMWHEDLYAHIKPCPDWQVREAQQESIERKQQTQD